MEVPALFLLPAVLLGGEVGALIGSGIQQSSDNVDGRVAEIQTYNNQLQNQLEVGSRVVAHLSLTNDGDRTYTFDSVNSIGQKEVCTGDYDVQKDDTARLVGSMACTVTMPLK